MKTRKFGFGTGTTSLITLLVALLLVMLVSLSMSATKVQNNFTNKITAQNAQYMQADTAAQEMLAAIDTALEDGTALPIGCSVEGNNISFQIPVSEHTYLQVALQIQTSGSSRYIITEYKTVSSITWQPDEPSGNLWEGGNNE